MNAKNLVRYLALGALFLVPLSPLIVANPFFFPFITGKAFFFRIVIEVAVAAWLLLALVDKEYRPRFSYIGATALAFVLWMLIADSFAINAVKAFWSNFERMEGWVLLIHLYGFFLAASAVLRVEKKWRGWFLASLAVSVIVVLYSLLQLSGTYAIHQGANRIDATFGNSAYLAIYLLFNTFIAGWLALTETRAWLKYGLIALAVIEAVLIFYTETRGTMLGLIGGLALAALLAALTAGGRARNYAGIALITLGIVIGGFLMIKDSSSCHANRICDRIASISLADGQVRFMIWGMAWRGFEASPVVGYGQEGFNYVFNKYYNPAMYAQEPWFDRAHNAFIDWLMAGGLPAFLLYLALFATAITALWRNSQLSRAERIALTAALLGYAFHNLFVFDNLYSYVYFFAILALIDSQVARPIAHFENAREVDGEIAYSTWLPLIGVSALVIIWFVNVTQMQASSDLIQALSQQQGGVAQNLAAFKSILDAPPPQAQEVREQLVNFASEIASASSLSADTRAQVTSYTVDQLILQNQNHPGDARSLLELSVAYQAEGDLAHSLAAIQAAELAAPTKEAIYLQEGQTRANMGDAVGAQAAFQKAYELGPQFPELATYAAAGDLLVGNVSGSKALLQKTFGTTNVDSDVLAAAYYQAKDFQDLIALWQLRNSGANASAQTAFGLAAAYYVAGEKAQAIAQIQAAIKQYPDSAAQGAEALKQIEAGVR